MASDCNLAVLSSAERLGQPWFWTSSAVSRESERRLRVTDVTAFLRG